MRSLKTYISILRSVKNRPTKYFIYLVLAIVALFLQAYMHNYNIVYLVMFFIVGVAGASSFFGIFNLYNIKAKLLSHERFFAGESSFFNLSIKNDSDSSAFDIYAQYKEQTQYIRSIPAHHTKMIKFKESFQQRGRAELGSVLLYSYFPLPHEKKYKTLTLDTKVVVFAKPGGVSLFKSLYKNNAVVGELSEFEGIKKFQQGDSTSYIHWASLAKNNTLMIKDFLYEDESKKLHFTLKNLKGDTEERLSQLTLWVLECEKGRLDFTIELQDEILDSKKVGIDEILKTIALY
jgi:uncharacterized protein (DUF58 family)